MPRPLQAPEKELRFTRSGQAPLFWIAAAMLVAGAVTVLGCWLWRDINLRWTHVLWVLAPLVPAVALVRVALHLTRHAYLILTPLGIEIFPFFRPAERMQLVAWGEIADAEINADLTQLTLHFNVGKTSGIHLSLKPIRADLRELLVIALGGRLSKGAPATVAAPN